MAHAAPYVGHSILWPVVEAVVVLIMLVAMTG